MQQTERAGSKYRVVIHDEPARDCWADFDRGWDALEYAKDAARQGYVADVLYDGHLETTYDPQPFRAVQ